MSVTGNPIRADDKRAKCEIRNGDFVDPCWALEETTEGFAAFSKGRGVYRLETYKDGQPSRAWYVMRSGGHKGLGLSLNHCPFCGADISAPFEARATQEASGRQTP